MIFDRVDVETSEGDGTTTMLKDSLGVDNRETMESDFREASVMTERGVQCIWAEKL